MLVGLFDAEVVHFDARVVRFELFDFGQFAAFQLIFE
jgi:hypothetical protein